MSTFMFILCSALSVAAEEPSPSAASEPDLEMLQAADLDLHGTHRRVTLTDGRSLVGLLEDTGTSWRLTEETGLATEIPFELVVSIAHVQSGAAPGAVSPAAEGMPSAAAESPPQKSGTTPQKSDTVHARSDGTYERIVVTDRPDGGFDDANLNRYLYAPSGFTLGEGNAYFSQKELIWSSLAFGISDGVDIQLGTIVPALVVPGGANFLFGIKGAHEVAPGLRLGGGAQSTLFQGLGGMATTVFANVTVGTEERHGSFNLGAPTFIGDGYAEVGAILLNADYYTRIGPRVALVAELWTAVMPFGDTFTLPAGGVRFIGDRFSTNVGSYNVITQNSDLPFLPIPWVDFTWRLGA